MFTGVLKNDCTEDQIMSAKKTVRVTTEVNGHQYVSEFEGTDVVAFVHESDGVGCRTEGQTICNGHAMTHFISALLEQLPVEDRLPLMFKLYLNLKNHEHG